MDLDLGGKVAIVTGGARGIGRVICRTFAEEGASVVIADILGEGGQDFRDEGGRSTEDLAKALGVGALYVRTDIRKLEDAQRLAQAALDKFGKVDILVNCAAVWRHNFFWDANPEDWRMEVDVCLMGVIYCCRAVVPGMMQRKSGMIVNFASDAGRIGQKGETVYGAAKAGVIGFTKGLALELGRHGICVNSVSPAGTVVEHTLHGREELKARAGEEAVAERQRRQLQFYPLGKLGTPEDVANMVVFLSSQKRAGHITGQTISVNGGYCMV